MGRSKRNGLLVGVTATVGLLSWGAVTAFACTILPSASLSRPYGLAGSDTQLTGTSWPVPGLGAVQSGVVSIRWDAANGPVLGTATPDAHGTLGPVTIRIPANAEPGYHVIVTDDQNHRSDSRARSVFQVVGNGGAPAGQPQALFGNATSSPQTGIGAGAISLLAAAGTAGLLLAGYGGASMARGYRRTPATSRIARR